MSLPAHACTRCGLPTHHRGSRCTDCYLPYAQETAMPAQRSRTLTRPSSTDEHDRGEHWSAYGACSDADPELFYEPDGPGRERATDRRERIADAKSYCARCPVAQECLDDALDEGDAVTIRGGRTSEERDDIRRVQRGRRWSA